MASRALALVSLTCSQSITGQPTSETTLEGLLMSAIPQYFPDNLDLPLPTDHKTWHTERLCPPLLAYALGSDRAFFIAQLHYWLQNEEVGVYKHGWHWIWNAEWEWQEQFPWWSEDKVGCIRRSLEREGYFVSNNFNRNPRNRTKYSTLDYYKLAKETGWNPLGLDLSREYPHPPQFVKGQRQLGRHRSDDVESVYSGGSENPAPSFDHNSAKTQNASRTPVKIHSAPRPDESIFLPNNTTKEPPLFQALPSAAGRCQLLKSAQFRQWEREFLTSVLALRALSPRQQEVLSRIEAKVGVKG